MLLLTVRDVMVATSGHSMALLDVENSEPGRAQLAGHVVQELSLGSLTANDEPKHGALDHSATWGLTKPC